MVVHCWTLIFLLNWFWGSLRLFFDVWSENAALFEILMEFCSNLPILHYGFTSLVMMIITMVIAIIVIARRKRKKTEVTPTIVINCSCDNDNYNNHDSNDNDNENNNNDNDNHHHHHHQHHNSDDNNDNNNNSCIYNAHISIQRECSRRNILLLPGHWIQFKDRTYSAQFPLPMEHSLPSCLSWRYRQLHTRHILHILPGTHLYKVESSNIDKVYCWRTKIPGIDRNRTRNPLMRIIMIVIHIGLMLICSLFICQFKVKIIFFHVYCRVISIHQGRTTCSECVMVSPELNWIDLNCSMGQYTYSRSDKISRAVFWYGKKHIGRYRYEDISYRPIPI